MWKTALGLVLCLLLTGCQDILYTPQVQPTDHSEIVITASLNGLQYSDQWQAQLVFTRGRHSFQEDVPITGEELCFSLGVPVGTWELELVILDESGEPLFQDHLPEITVYPNTPSTFEMNLLPAEGLLRVILELNNYAQREEVMRTRIHLDDEITEVIREDLSEPLQAEIPLLPGDYDLKIELFTGSFRATDKIHEGICQTIAIEPATEKEIIWNPEIEEVEIIGVIGVIPEAPSNLVGQFISNDAVELTWQASPSDGIAGYIVYCQLDPFERFTQINEEPTSECSFIHQLPEERNSRISYVVAAVFPNGQVGYRSKVVTLEQ